MSKRYTPAKSALAKRAAFTRNRQQFSVCRKPLPPIYSVKVQIAESNVHGTLLALWGQRDLYDVLATRRAFSYI